MPSRRRHTDLRGRRQDLGVTVNEMAAGLGMSICDIVDIEKGTGASDGINHYAAWLTRMEAWSDGKRERELRGTRQGQRFT
jgi:transcriptional regulator with XRE-family HTH domain